MLWSFNIGLFLNAKIYTRHAPYSNKSSIFHGWDNDIDVWESPDNYMVTDDVKVILTPGHLEDHFSVVVNTDDGVVVACGDAIQK